MNGNAIPNIGDTRLIDAPVSVPSSDAVTRKHIKKGILIGETEKEKKH